MFGGLGVQEIVIILLLVVLLFGAKKLPELGKSVGEGLREFKKSMSSINSEEEKKS